MPQKKKNKSNAWVIYALVAMVLFACANVFLSVVTAKAGIFSYLYWCLGAVLICIFQHIYKMILQYRNRGTLWVDFNFVIDGRLKWINVVGFTALSFNLLINQNIVNICMWTAHLAQINVGVIAVIWSMTPLLQALFDYVVFKQRLTYNLWIGMVLMVGACALLSIQPFIIKPKESEELVVVDGNNQVVERVKVLAPWVPVIFGIITPFFFTCGNIIIKYLNDDAYGIKFTSNQLSNNTIFIFNTIGLIASAIIWTRPQPVLTFEPNLFIIGIFGSAVNQVAINFCLNALTLGPQGPACAIMVSCTLILTFVEAIRHSKVPNYIELISLASGFIGAVLMAAPDVVEKLFGYLFCCTCCKIREATLVSADDVSSLNEQIVGQEKYINKRNQAIN